MSRYCRKLPSGRSGNKPFPRRFPHLFWPNHQYQRSSRCSILPRNTPRSSPFDGRTIYARTDPPKARTTAGQETSPLFPPTPYRPRHSKKNGSNSSLSNPSSSVQEGDLIRRYIQMKLPHPPYAIATPYGMNTFRERTAANFSAPAFLS